jgi:hypothetical protein
MLSLLWSLSLIMLISCKCKPLLVFCLFFFSDYLILDLRGDNDATRLLSLELVVLPLEDPLETGLSGIAFYTTG